MSTKTKIIIVITIWAIVSLSVLIVSHKLQDGGSSKPITFKEALADAEYLSYDEYNERLAANEVHLVWYRTDTQYMLVFLKSEYNASMTQGELLNYKFYDASEVLKTLYPAGDTFRVDLLDKGVTLILDQTPSKTATVLEILLQLVPSLLILALLVYYFKFMMHPVKDNISELVEKVPDVSFDQIIGLNETLDDLQLIVHLIKDPMYGKSIGASPTHGVLLAGEPGVGKTMIAKAIAHEAGVKFIQAAGSDFKEMYVGVGARRVRSLFELARKNAPCILFIDEIDAIGVSRDNYVNSSSEDTQTINALLKEMDGFKELNGVFVIAATNFPDNIDKAITRSGRFDRTVRLLPPKSWEVRAQLFRLYLDNLTVGKDVDIETLSRITAGFTGADIKTVCNEAALVALSHEHEYVTHDDIEEAIDRKIFDGSRSKSKVNEEDKKIVAYHEAGHAVMSILCGLPVARITIQATTSGVGGVVFNEDPDTSFRSKQYFTDRAMVAYAGHASEEIKFSSVTTGASNDIEQATEIIHSYIDTYGFDTKVSGALSLSKVTTKTEERMRKLSISLYDKTLDKLRKNYDMVESLATRLLEVEKMTGQEVYDFLQEDKNECKSIR